MFDAASTMLKCARLDRFCRSVAGLVHQQCHQPERGPLPWSYAVRQQGRPTPGSWSSHGALRDGEKGYCPQIDGGQQRKARRSFVRAQSTTSVAEQASSTAEAAGHHSNRGQAAENAAAPTFQEAIQKLQTYWASQGCAVLQSSNTEVGAGTMNPATFLRILGPEPWNVAYVEPSIRPDDSRYGDNPNRVQRHTQFQVILKPDPGNSQELYLGSLAALGIDTRAHDIRFVEDNWESPVLGAWGLGWEVWMDGMEVTQFTYMQQAGSLPLTPVPVEITYGLERIIMALQGVDHFKKIRYAPGITYGELFLENEREMSAFNLDHADVERTRQRFELYEAEARALLEKKLAIPAYDHVLKTSHAFNILDARGAVGVTERQRFFGKMRNLARECSTLWVETRASLGHPLGVATLPPEPQPEASTSAAASAEPRMLVLEIGSEELPPQDVVAAIQQLRASIPAVLAKLRLRHGVVRVCGTPRRLCVLVADVEGRQADLEEELRGPPAKAAFKDGQPTKAAEGFCRKNGVAVADLVVRPDEKGVEYAYATVRQEGRPAAQVLGEELAGVVAGLQFPKSMRWSTQVAYSRPLRWLLALHGDTVVPFTYAGAASGRGTRLLRNADETEQSVASAEEYIASMEAAGLQVDGEERSTSIWEAASNLASEIGGRIPDNARGDLLEEVAYLVEAPAPLLGTFDAAFLTLPREVLTTVMRKHQRYFPVEDAATGQLKPAFVTVANGPVDLDVVRHGNEAVLRARYEDARFFYTADRARPLASFRPLLDGITFQAQLGSLLAKSEREEALLPGLAAAAQLEGDALAVARTAASMAKADLATAVVTEFTSLAGVIGRHYADMEGHPQPVCDAVFEAVLPRFAGDQVPRSGAGILLAVADRLDSLVGLFAVGKAPSASADPFGLRRAAYGLVQTLVENGVPLALPAALRLAAEQQPLDVSEAALAEVDTFVTRRLEQYLVDGGATVEVVRAALAERGAVPAQAAQAVREMEALDSGVRERIVAAYARPTRITRTKDVGADWKVNSSLFEMEQEHALLAAYTTVAQQLRPESAVSELFAVSEALVQPIDDFFSNVFVMAEDEAVRRNRLALLRDIAALPKGILDLALLPGF